MYHLIYAANHYNLSHKTYAMQLDGQQSLAISLLAWERLNLIVEEMHIHTPHLNVRFVWLSCTLGLLAGCISPLAEYYLKKYPDPITSEEKIFTDVCKLLTKAGKTSQAILQHADKVLNTACLINAVALIAMGFPVNGSIVLCGLFILALKRYQYLPASVEKYIDPMAELAGLAALTTLHIHIIFKVIIAAYHGTNLIVSALNSKTVRAHLPAQFTNPFQGKHVNDSTDSNGTIISKATNRRPCAYFQVDPTYVYSDEVGRLLPTECDQSLETSDPSTLFDQLHDKIKTSKIELTEEQQRGLNNLRVCALTGRVADTAPTDIELFQKILKALIQSILNDDDNFEVQVEDLANLGISCVEGWTRDITTMLSPQTKEIAWAVHHVLAKMRGEVIKTTILDYNNKIPLLSAAGGSNNIHVTNAVQRAFWHRFRSFEGELNQQLTSSTLSTLLLRYIVMKNNIDRPAFLERCYMGFTLTNAHPGLAADGGFVAINLAYAMERSIKLLIMNSDTTVDAIYDAIKPEYQLAADGRVDRVDLKRVIPWEAILNWMSAIAERRGIHICNPDTYEYDARFVERDIAGKYYLSKAGVILLLWDLGILKTTSRT